MWSRGCVTDSNWAFPFTRHFSLPNAISSQRTNTLQLLTKINEVSLGRVAGPFDTPPLPSFHISTFGVTPKKGQPGKWWLIVDLPSHGRTSVNHRINPDDFTLHYVTIDHIICLVSLFDKGALLATLMWKQLIKTLQYTLPITSFWAWNGVASFMLTRLSPLAFTQPPTFSIQQLI